MATKRFQCHYCDAQFNRSEHFKRHERSHTGEKPFTCVICGVSFVRNDLMLRHGRLKHKTNLGKQPSPPKLDSVTSTTSPSPDRIHSLASLLPEHLDTSTVDMDGYFAALDSALYVPWTVPDTTSLDSLFLDHQSRFTIPDTHELLLQNGFRDTLVKAAQSMSQLPKIPSTSSLKCYVSLFIEKFLPHIPFLPPSFNTETANPLLLISMSSIGALYCAERKTALMFHTVAKNLEENLRSSMGYENYPLWAVQSLYLNSTFAAWSGLSNGIQYAIIHMPILAMLGKIMYRQLLGCDSPTQFEEWIEIETMRRTYFCIYVFSGMITLVFGLPPVVTAVDPRGLSLPCSSDEWNSKTHSTSMPASELLYDSAMMALWSGNPLHCSTFGIRILATSIFLEIWQTQHGYGSWLSGDWRERHYIVLGYLQNHINFTLHISPSDSDPLIWDASFILYECYARLANDTTFVEEGFCHSSGPAIFQGLKSTYSQFNMSNVDLRSIRAALTGFTEALRRGLKFGGHTGCWPQGLEHVLGGFHSGTLLVHWIRRIEETNESTPEEAELMGELRKSLEERDIHIYPESLAVTLSRSIIQLIDQVWIWGITPLMGDAFRLYAEEILESRGAITDVEQVFRRGRTMFGVW